MPRGVTFGEIYNQLPGLVEGLSSVFAQEIVNQVREDLFSQRDWGFLFTENVIRIPTLINSSTVSVVKYSRSVVVTSTIQTILDAISINEVELIGRQFQLANSQRIYTIEDWNSGTLTLTLDQFITEDTNTAATYEIFKCYVSPPFWQKANGDNVVDFRRFHSILDLKYFRKLRTDISPETLSRIDPLRFAQGTPFCLVPYKLDSIENPLFEIYPHEKVNEERVFRVLYIRDGYDFELDEETFPYVFSKKLLIAACKSAAYEWAEAHKGSIPELQKTSWFNLIALTNAKSNRDGVDEQLNQAIKKDEEQFPKAIIETFNSYSYYDGLNLAEGVYGGNNYLNYGDTSVTFGF